MTKRKNGRMFMLGTLIGGLIGGVTALLMTPQSGEKTQEIVLEKRDKFLQEAEKRFDEGRHLAAEKVIETRNAVAEWLSQGGNLLDEKSKEIKVEKSSQNKQTAAAS